MSSTYTALCNQKENKFIDNKYVVQKSGSSI